MIIDFHMHLVPGLKAGEPRTRYAYGIPASTQHGLLGDTERLLQTMDEAGIDFAVLSNVRGLAGQLDVVRSANEDAARVAAEHPTRLGFMAFVPSPAEAGGLAEVERWFDRAPGVAAPSSFGDIELDDERLEPLYALLEERQRFLWIHPGSVAGEADVHRFQAYDLFRTVGREFSLVLATLRLVLSGVLDRHPRLTVIMSHLGGGISSLVPRIRHYQDKAMWGLTGDPLHGRRPEREFDEYLSHIYFDTGGFFGDPAAVRVALEHIPPARVLLGTDYPQEIRDAGTIRTLVGALRDLGIAGNGSALLAGVGGPACR